MSRLPETDRALERWGAWRRLHAERLAEYHPDVRTEVEMTVRDRFLAGNFDPLTAEDQRRCLMRVASRMRIKGGNTPAGEAGSGEQLKALVEMLSKPAQQRAA